MEIRRSIQDAIREHLNKPQITLLIGPRQAGKTTIILDLAQELELKGEKTFNLNLDIQSHSRLLANQADFVERLKLEFGSSKGYVFVDEVQRKENAGLYFKGLYDMDLPYKFVLTGSGSVELKEKVSESLAGRKRLFEINTVNFREYVDYRTNYAYEEGLDQFIRSAPEVDGLLRSYLQFGGYPRVIMAETQDQKRLEIQEIFTSYLEKDIVQLLQVRKTEAFSKLVALLAAQMGSGVKIDELSSTLGLDQETIKRYLWYLEKTFIMRPCRPYYTNPRLELIRTPLYFFNDLGMRNYALHRFVNTDLYLEGGALFEGFIFNHLHQKYGSLGFKTNYWRTKSGAEIDFVIDASSTLIPVEVKYKNLRSDKAGKSVYSFISKYHPKTAYIVNLEHESEKVKTSPKDGQDTVIKHIPYRTFLTENLLRVQ